MRPELYLDSTNPVREHRGLPAESESVFQRKVVQLARLCHWRVYHTFDSRRSDAGFPDLVLVRSVRLIFAELKSDKGVVSPAQRSWLYDLQEAASEAYVWRPRDWGEIVQVLN